MNNSIAITRNAFVALILLLLTACPSGGGGGESGSLPSGPDMQAVARDVAATEVQARGLVRLLVRDQLTVPDPDKLFAAIDSAQQDFLTQTLGQIAASAVPAGSAVLPLANNAAALPPSVGSYVSVLANGGVGIGMVGAMIDKNVHWPPGTTHNTRQTNIDANLGGGSLTQEVTTILSAQGSHLIGEVIVGGTYTAADGQQTKNTITAHIDADMCPDAQGQVKVQYTLHWEMSVLGSGVNSQIDMSGTALGAVGDNAELLNWTSDSTFRLARQTAATSGSPAVSSYIQAHNQTASMWGSDPATAVIKHEISGDTTSVFDPAHATSVAQGVQDMQVKLPTLFETFALNSAKEHWQNGACVEILLSGVTDSNTVDPSSVTPFTAKVRHKFENVELPAPITAALTGEKSIAPMQQTPAPVSYSYTAPDSDGKSATAHLESRSKRGIAKKDVGFNTKASLKYTGDLTFNSSEVFTNGDRIDQAGTARVTFVRNSVSSGGASFMSDPATTSVTISSYSSTKDSNRSSARTCTMVGTVVVSAGHASGALLVVSVPSPMYVFELSGSVGAGDPAPATLRCVRLSDGYVEFPVNGAVGGTMGTMPGTIPGFPGYLPLTDAKLLSGSATYTTVDPGVSTLTQNSTWSLAGQ